MVQKGILTPKQKRSIATKKKIKRVAKRLFASKGYYKVTTNNIAAAAKVPIGSFYNYFGNKKEVLLELVKDFNSAYHLETIENDSEVVQKITSKAVVLEHLEFLFGRAILSPQLADPFYRVIHALQFTEPDVLAISEEMRQIEMGHMINFLKQINEFHPVPDIPVTAKVIHSSLENIALYIHHLGTTHEKNELIRRTVEMIYGLLFFGAESR